MLPACDAGRRVLPEDPFDSCSLPHRALFATFPKARVAVPGPPWHLRFYRVSGSPTRVPQVKRCVGALHPIE
ncbi:hypothetical protein GCM10010185_69330 [Saccharothrix coeruleofusca]|uniref:Uncharacterized protein n=1 Tax=Saccharothrix coeruleofusca TaxID=33919 RepID=A0A918AUB7_9PSEU|nr:hypothetical protein GCM10010185_69330 [Saccharothrix coeruleofusca]